MLAAYAHWSLCGSQTMPENSEVSKGTRMNAAWRNRSLYLFIPLAFVGVLVLLFGQGLTRDLDALPSPLIGRSF